MSIEELDIVLNRKLDEFFRACYFKKQVGLGKIHRLVA